MTDDGAAGPRTGTAARIAAERDRVGARIGALERELEILFTATEDAPDDEHDPEGATIGFERAQVTALLTAAQARLVELGQAEERIADGTYGVCEVCGRPINDERLDARPATRRCVACADLPG